MKQRSITDVVTAHREDIADLQTRQAITEAMHERLDPFLLLAHHGPQVYAPGNRGLPFGPHPHRGFETVTFIRAGSLAHHDTGGHQSVIDPGGVQWMTAGSGLIHAEVSPPAFRRDGGPLEILQLWVNLPPALKMTAPRYAGVQAAAIPDIPLDDGRVRVALVAGTLDGVAGPVASLSDVFMSTVVLDEGGQATLPAPAGRRVLFYVVDGEVVAGGATLRAGKLGVFGDGDIVTVSAPRGATLLFAHADPTGAPIVAEGPFVMNSEQEIAQAYRDHAAGRFDGVPISLELTHA